MSAREREARDLEEAIADLVLHRTMDRSVIISAMYGALGVAIASIDNESARNKVAAHLGQDLRRNVEKIAAGMTSMEWRQR